MPRAEGSRWRRAARVLREFLYGMALYEMVRDVERERHRMERAFAALTFGGLMGMPLPAGFYSLRLVPYALPHLDVWRRGLWHERELTELCEQELT